MNFVSEKFHAFIIPLTVNIFGFLTAVILLMLGLYRIRFESEAEMPFNFLGTILFCSVFFVTTLSISFWAQSTDLRVIALSAMIGSTVCLIGIVFDNCGLYSQQMCSVDPGFAVFIFVLLSVTTFCIATLCQAIYLVAFRRKKPLA
jgi:hypothetical protein